MIEALRRCQKAEAALLGRFVHWKAGRNSSDGPLYEEEPLPRVVKHCRSSRADFVRFVDNIGQFFFLWLANVRRLFL